MHREAQLLRPNCPHSPWNQASSWQSVPLVVTMRRDWHLWGQTKALTQSCCCLWLNISGLWFSHPEEGGLISTPPGLLEDHTANLRAVPRQRELHEGRESACFVQSCSSRSVLAHRRSVNTGGMNEFRDAGSLPCSSPL